MSNPPSPPSSAPPDSIEAALARWLAEGRARIGQIIILPKPDGGFSLRHLDDANADSSPATVADSLLLSPPEDAGRIARDDDADEYRPLKTAPNLRRGWRLDAADLPALRRALEGFYPGRLAAFLRWQEGRLPATPLRETLGRQTGMYRVTQKITDEQADVLVGRFCRSDGGCLRTILWRLHVPADPPPATLPPEKFDPIHDQTGHGANGAGFIPLFCQEACNLLVAEARAVVKGKKDT